MGTGERINLNTTSQNISIDFSYNKHTISDAGKKNTFSNFFRKKLAPKASNTTELKNRDSKKVSNNVNNPSTKVEPFSFSNDSSVKSLLLNGEEESQFEMTPVNENNSSSDAENAANKNWLANVDISVGQNFLESVFGKDAKSELTDASKPKLLKALCELKPSTSADVLGYALGNEKILKRLNELDSSLIETLVNNILKPPTGKVDHSAVEKLLKFVLGNEEALKRLNDFGSKLLTALVGGLLPSDAAKIFESALKNKEIWDRLNNSGPNLRDALVGGLPSPYVAEILISALGDEATFERLKSFGPGFLERLVYKLESSDAAEILKFAFQKDGINTFEPGLLDTLVYKLESSDAAEILKFALQKDGINTSEPDLLDTLVYKLESSDDTENFLQSALDDEATLEGLNKLEPELLKFLVDNLNPFSFVMVMQSALLDVKTWDRLNKFRPESLKILVGNLNPFSTAWILQSALLDAKIWDWLNNSEPNLVSALVDRLNAFDDPISTVESLFNSDGNLNNLNEPRLQFLNDLVAKLGKKGKFHRIAGKLEFVPENT